MTFLNPYMLIGLAGVAVPILLHLLHRRRAEVIDWGAMQFLLASVASRSRRIRLEQWLLLLARCLLLALPALAMARPFIEREQLVGRSRQGQDVAIVVDGSMSMTVRVGETTNFQRAVDRAKRIVAACRPSDAVSVILAGGSVRGVIAEPTGDLAAAADALDQLTPPLGAMRPLQAIEAATASCLAGRNTAKRIVVITDGQSAGWDLTARRRWRFLADGLGQFPTRPVVLIHTLRPPDRWSNLAIGRVTLGRKIIGMDRLVSISAQIANTGSAAQRPQAVLVAIDGEAQPVIHLDRDIPPGSTETVELMHSFDEPGPHVVTIGLSGEDDLPGDDKAVHVVDVLETLGVLIADGDPSPVPLAGDGEFIQIALSRSTRGRGAWIQTRAVEAPDLPGVKDLSPYAVVILANVPRLPREAADRLAKHVAGGGGLLIAPGDKVQAAFYNEWAGPTGRRLTPARLIEQADDTAAGEKAIRPALTHISMAALAKLADPAQYDLNRLLVRRHWRLAVDDADENAAIGALLETGDPLIVTRPVGNGRVAMLAVPVDGDWTNLPALDCFTPLAHELVHHLASPTGGVFNLAIGEPFTFAAAGGLDDMAGAKVLTPDGRTLQAVGRYVGDTLQVRFDGTDRPGLHRLLLPAAALGEQAGRPTVADGVPFAVAGDPAESDLALLDEADFVAMREYADVRQSVTLDRLVAAIRGQTPGVEIWPYLALAALLVAVAEIALARWVAVQRKIHQAHTVQFGAQQVSAEALRRQVAVEPPREQVRA